MPNSIGRFFAAALVIALLANAVHAGPLVGDPAALFSGTQPFSGFNGFKWVKADIDYAVYAPGAFSTSGPLHLNSPPDFSGGTEYIYAYEIFNTGTSLDAHVASLSVGLFPNGVSDNATLIGHVPDPSSAGAAPVASNFNPAAAATPKVNAFWSFSQFPATLGFGQHSEVLIFASPNPPSFKVSSITGGFATGASADLPSPVPEPGSLVLVAMALISLVGFRVFRRRLH